MLLGEGIKHRFQLSLFCLPVRQTVLILGIAFRRGTFYKDRIVKLGG